MSDITNIRKRLGIARCEEHRGFPPPPPPEDGVDIEHIDDNLRLTPAERLRQAELWANIFCQFQSHEVDDEDIQAFVQSLLLT